MAATATATKTITPAHRLERLSAAVERALAQALPRAAQAPGGLDEALRYCVLSGGKRFRPLLCLGACEAAGAPVRRALNAACAIELLHTYSLVHDDLPAMDDAAERRGQPSCHRRFGEATAILTGDALLTLAFELLGRNGTPNALAIVRALGEACGTAGLIGGQQLDLAAAHAPDAAGEQALRDIARRKTAALITASAVAGGLAGGASAATLARLRRYGRGIGVAFQLMDDVQDGDGLVRPLGAARARREAQRAVATALQAIEPLGARAATLRSLAAWLASTAQG